MNTVLAFDKMEKLLPYVADIIGDETVAEFKRESAKKTSNSGEMMKILLPLFTTKKRDSFLAILSIMSDKEVKEIGEQDFTQTLQDMQNGFIGDMITFFICAVRMVARA